MKRFHFITASALFVCLFVTAVSVYFLYDAQRAKFIELDEVAAQRQTRLLQSMIDRDINAIGAAANFFHATGKDDWSEFPRFVEGLVSRSDGLIAIQWMEKVDAERVEKHMQSVRKKFPDARFYTVDKDSAVTDYDSGREEPFYISTDVYPNNKVNQNVIGFYPSQIRFNKILDLIQTKRQLALSDKLTLIQDDINGNAPADGFLVYYPVFEDEGDELKGVLIGALRASVYFDYIVSQSQEGSSIALRITDSGFSAGDSPVLYQSSSWDMDSYHDYADFIYFSNRVWTVNFRFQQQVFKSDKFSLLFVILSGTAVSFLIATMVHGSLSKQETLEKRLEERTRELNYLVNHDPQTGALNRRAFNKISSQFTKERHMFSLATFDVDNFKLINDAFGHPIGDAALAHIAKLIEGKLEKDDRLFRVGGDEFYILSRKNEPGELYHYLDGIRDALASSVLDCNASVRMTISMGAAVWRGEEMESLAHKVDRELYESKRKGRNTVSVYQG